MHIYRELKVSRDMGHELFKNMREGDWYLDYSIHRLTAFMKEELELVIDYLQKCLQQVKKLSKYLRPKYGSRVIEKLYNAVLYDILKRRMNDSFINRYADDAFVQKLALASLQMYGRVPSAKFNGHEDTMAAGLPHFSTGYTRCWGRDTFIALRGLML